MSGLLYFIQSGTTGPIKVGRAANPERRLAQLQTGNPERLRIVWTHPEGERERDAHEYLEDSHIGGEWFGVEETLAYIVTECGAPLSLLKELGYDADLIVPELFETWWRYPSTAPAEAA